VLIQKGEVQGDQKTSLQADPHRRAWLKSMQKAWLRRRPERSGSLLHPNPCRPGDEKHLLKQKLSNHPKCDAQELVLMQQVSKKKVCCRGRHQEFDSSCHLHSSIRRQSPTLQPQAHGQQERAFQEMTFNNAIDSKTKNESQSDNVSKKHFFFFKVGGRFITIYKTRVNRVQQFFF
jgi:hypothetical protein